MTTVDTLTTGNDHTTDKVNNRSIYILLGAFAIVALLSFVDQGRTGHESIPTNLMSFADERGFSGAVESGHQTRVAEHIE